jgi:hypothetical protein
VLLWCFDVSDYREERTESAMLTPCCYECLLVVDVFSSVVVRVLVVAKQQSLPDEVNGVRAAVEASLRRVEVSKLARYSRDCSVVIASIVKYKVTQRIRRDPVCPQCCNNCCSDRLTGVGIVKLRQSYRQVVDLTRRRSKVSNNPKKPRVPPFVVQPSKLMCILLAALDKASTICGRIAWNSRIA